MAPRDRLDGLRDRLSGLSDSLSSIDLSLGGDGEGQADDEGQGLLSGPIIRYGLPLSVLIVGVYALMRLGPATILTPDRLIYFIVFVCAAALVPGIIALNGPALSTFKLDGVLGKINWTLGMLTFGMGILVQRANGDFEMWPARRENGHLELYLDGKWKRIEGEEHLSRLGWRPFGIIFEKTTQSLKPYLEDFGQGELVADGEGLRGRRGGYDEQTPSSGKKHHWLLDAVRLRPRKSAAGTELINRAEMKEIENQSSGGRLASWSNVIGAVMGLLIGSIMAYIIFGS